MNEKVKQLIKRHTGGTYQIGVLRGPRFRQARREILEEITGKSVSFDNAGINRLIDELAALAKIGPGRSFANQMQLIQQWLEEQQ